MASEISNIFRRQVLHAGNVFNFKELEVDSSASPLQNGSDSSITRNSTAKRRVIHVDYDEVFGSMETLPNLNSYDLPFTSPSPKYEQTVGGLSDESLEYFPQRRRGSRRFAARIVRNLTAEFDQLADDFEADPVSQDKRFLKVPSYWNYQKRETKWDEIKAKSNFDKSKNEQQLRRKPIPRRAKENGEQNGLTCIIC